MILFDRKYLDGGLDADTSDFAVAPNRFVNMENARFGSTFFARGSVGGLESIGSTSLIASSLPSMQNYCIGSVYDEQRNRILWFNWSSIGVHLIKCYDINTNIVYTVLYDSQIIGGFNFDKNVPIHSGRIINGLLYWVEERTNQPRKINIDAAIKMNNPSYVTDAVPYQSPIDFREITIIKPPPPLAPNIMKDTDGSFVNNFIANDSFMFAFQYIYYDNETTVPGTYSPASKLNAVTDTFNRIIVTMDSLEVIPQTVRFVQLLVRLGTTGTNCFIVKQWDKEIAADATAIADQNSGTQVLTYNFYNNTTGPFIAQDQILKPFDSVPVYAGALEVAENRLFLGDNTSGYNAPLITSLTSQLITIPISGSTLTKPLIKVSWLWWNQNPGGPPSYDGAAYSGWYIYLNASEVPGENQGYYAITATEQSVPQSTFFTAVPPPPAIPAFPAAPTTITLIDIAFRGLATSDVLVSTNYNPLPLPPPGRTFHRETNFVLTGSNVDITGISVSTYNIFKTESPYRLGVVFYDFAMRKCGVVTNDNAVASIPSRDYAFTSGISNIAWSLSNVDALTEIPDWAYYYTIVRTLNLRTRFFINSYDEAAKYASKDSSGNYVYTATTYTATSVAIALNTTALIQSGLGYIFSDNDQCILIDNANNEYHLPVIGQDGNYILLKVQDIGDLSTTKFVYEIYTPYQSSTQEPYYETGEMYKVSNPGTTMRVYSALSGLLNADAFVLTRNYNSTTYFAEAMCPNDLFYQRWDTDAGKVNLITNLGQQRLEQGISFSNTYIPGTSVNGLSTFEALNTSSVPQDCGIIEKLILTSKEQEQGTLMLAICQRETASLYLGEARITDSTGSTQFFSSVTNIIGTINILKGSFGTLNPESAIEYKGEVYWLDVSNGKYIQYSINGLFPISNYKINKFWKLFSETYKSLTTDQIEALGSRPFIFSGIDPNSGELLVSVPRVLATPPLGYLPDYPDLIYPFDIWDGQAKSIVFNLYKNPNDWGGAFNITAENYIYVGNDLYSFKNGALYQHGDETSFCNFYGIQYTTRIMLVSNQLPETPKVIDNLSVEANKIPLFTYIRTDSEYIQATDLVNAGGVNDWENKEGKFYADVLRDKLTPSATGLKPNALLTGDRMRGNVFKIMLEFDVVDGPLEFRFANIGFQESLGHTPPSRKQ